MVYKNIPESNPLGRRLRAARHGFFYSEEHDSFFRMIWVDKEREIFQVEVCPSDKIMQLTEGRSSKGGQECIRWDETPEQGRDILAQLQTPSSRFTRYEVLTYNGNGELVK